jgi:putative transposase
MSRSKHTEAQMIAALKQVEAGRKAEDVAREVGVSKHTLYAWKAKYGGMDVSQAQAAAVDEQNNDCQQSVDAKPHHYLLGAPTCHSKRCCATA